MVQLSHLNVDQIKGCLSLVNGGFVPETLSIELGPHCPVPGSVWQLQAEPGGNSPVRRRIIPVLGGIITLLSHCQLGAGFQKIIGFLGG